MVQLIDKDERQIKFAKSKQLTTWNDLLKWINCQPNIHYFCCEDLNHHEGRWGKPLFHPTVTRLPRSIALGHHGRRMAANDAGITHFRFVSDQGRGSNYKRIFVKCSSLKICSNWFLNEFFLLEGCKILLGFETLLTTVLRCSYGDSDKSRGALLSEGKHNLQVEFRSWDLENN